MPKVREFVEVWTSDAGTPTRLVWRARRYRVNDTPTPLVGPAEWWEPFANHEVFPGRRPLAIAGWRFQARSDDGETRVFDVGHDGEHWLLLRVFA